MPRMVATSAALQPAPGVVPGPLSAAGSSHMTFVSGNVSGALHNKTLPEIVVDAVVSAGNRTFPFATAARPAASGAWGLGLALELCGTFANVGGKQCFRLAAKHKNPWYYLLGLVLLIGVYSIFNNFAVRFAPNSVVSAVDGMIVVWNILLAPFTLGEAVTLSRLAGALLITVGTILSALLGNHTDQETTAQAYQQQLCTVQSIVYYCISVLAVSLLALAASKHPVDTRVGGACRCVLAGWCAGHTGVFQKAFWQVVADEGPNGFMVLYLFVYLILTAVAFAFLALTMRVHDALFALPIYESLLILGSASAGYALLREYVGNSAWRITGFWASLILLMLGLYVIVFWPTRLFGDGDRDMCPGLRSWLPNPPGKNRPNGVVKGEDDELEDARNASKQRSAAPKSE